MVCALTAPESGPESINNTARHRLLETEIDLVFLKKSQLLGGNLLRTYVENIEVHKDDFAAVLALFFDLHDKKSRLLMKKSLRDHCLVQSLFFKKWPTWPLILLNTIKPGIAAHILALSYSYAKRNPPVLNNLPVTYKHPDSGQPVSTTIEQLKTKAVEEILTIFSALETAGTRLELKNQLNKLNGPNLITGKSVQGNSASMNPKRHDHTFL